MYGVPWHCKSGEKKLSECRMITVAKHWKRKAASCMVKEHIFRVHFFKISKIYPVES